MNWKAKRELKFRKGLEGFSLEQQQAFAWRCVIRTLPFLAAEQKFRYWEDPKSCLLILLQNVDFLTEGGIYLKEVLQEYQIRNGETELTEQQMKKFHSSFIAKFKKKLDGVWDITSKASGIYYGDIDEEELAKYDGQYDDYYFYEDIPYSQEPVDAAFAVIRTTQLAIEMLTHQTIPALRSFETSIVDVVKSVFEVGENLGSFRNYKSIALEDILWEDLNDIKAGKAPQIDLTIYQKMNEYFIKAITNDGLPEYAKIYDEILKQNFKVDVEALKKRIEKLI